MSVDKIVDTLADIRVDPSEMGKRMAYQHSEVQDRVFQMFVGFIRELSIQDQTGGYINGNMCLATKGRLIDFLLTDNRIV